MVTWHDCACVQPARLPRSVLPALCVLLLVLLLLVLHYWPSCLSLWWPDTFTHQVGCWIRALHFHGLTVCNTCYLCSSQLLVILAVATTIEAPTGSARQSEGKGPGSRWGWGCCWTLSYGLHFHQLAGDFRPQLRTGCRVSTQFFCVGRREMSFSLLLNYKLLKLVGQILFMSFHHLSGQNSSFLDEFSDLLSSIIKLSKSVILGDFKFHIDNDADRFASSFMNITESFNLTQHVRGTYMKGHILDFIFTLGLNVDAAFYDHIFISDHKCVLYDLTFNVDVWTSWREINSHVFNNLLLNFLIVLSCCQIVMSAFKESFNEHCLSILDKKLCL